MKIGYLMQADAVEMSTVSGPQLHVKAVIQGLRKRGHDVRTVAIQNGEILWTDDLSTWRLIKPSFSKSTTFRLVESVVRGTQSRLKLPFFRFFDSIKFSEACVSALAGYDIFYQRDGTISYGGLLAARKLGIPFVIEVNGDLIEEWDQLGIQWPKPQEKTVHFITKQIYHHASHIVTVGETIRERLVDRWSLDPKHISVVTNGADIDLFLNSIGSPDVQSRFSIGTGPVIIFTGGFQPWHGIELIIDAFRQVASEKSDVKLVLVGDGPLRAELQELANSLNLGDRIIFTGRVDHETVAQLLNFADVAVIYHRGIAAEIVETPLKLFEYMAAGKAIVAPAVPNMKRILTDQVSAMLVQPDDPKALANTILKLLEEGQLRHSLGRAARKEAIDKHSWDRAVSEIEVIFSNLVEKPSLHTNEAPHSKKNLRNYSSR